MDTKVMEKLQRIAPEAKFKGSATVTLTASELEDLIKHVNVPRVAVLRVRRAGALSKLRNIKLQDDCYSVAEVAERFKVTKQAVYKWIQEEKVIFNQPSPGGRGYRIPKGQFQEKISSRNEFLERRKQLFGEDAEISLKHPQIVYRDNDGEFNE
ncbi:helix-turn-helix domain-containing protein [Paenibacillus donghaensis]|uniref:helix-turn-helix domain-containing protein n=1 Tax=Paenibacillus donghaensis TaxID=414771 RepID=UPI0012F95D8B|nr:helix-turn-helix domain-containing protein [Paenibacillus donghaensis]